MHILLIHQAFVSPKEAGGTRHFEFAQRCLSCGHHFTIVASNVSYLSGKSNEIHRGIIKAESVDGVDILRAYTFPAMHKNFVWRVLCFFSFMFVSVLAGLRAREIDVVMGTSPPIFQAVSAWAVAKLRGKPFILEIRDLWPEFAIDIGVLKNSTLIWLSRLLERFLYAQAMHLVVNSPAYRDYLIRKGIPQNKIALIPNGVDVNMFKPSGESNGFRKIFNLEGKFVVTYAGALGMANDIPVILKAADKLRAVPDIHFLLVGDGKDRKQLEFKKRNMGLENVTFTGTQPKSEMPNVLAASDVCLATLMDIPMFKTTYPNKVFDYMAAGRPTALVIDGVIREVIEAAQGGIFVPPGDATALAAAVEWMHENREDCQKMGTSAREYVAKHFNRNQQAHQFVGLIETLK